MIAHRETDESVNEKITVEVAFKKQPNTESAQELRQTIIRGVYTAWTVTAVSFSLNEDEPMKTVLDDSTYWSNLEEKPIGDNLSEFNTLIY